MTSAHAKLAWLRFGQWRRLAFWASLLTIWCVGAFCYHSIQVLVATEKAADAALELRFQAERLLSLLNDAQAGQRSYIITGDRAHLEPYRAALREAPAIVAQLNQMVAGQAPHERRLALLEPLIAERLTLLRANIERRDGGGLAGFSPAHFAQGSLVMERIERLIRAIEREETTQYARRVARAEQLALSSAIAIGVGLLFSTVVVALVFLHMNREVRRRATAEAEARRLTETLEQRVAERTAQIEMARAEAVVAAAELTTALKSADAANAAKSAFLANTSHELRTPLNAVIGFSELILRELHGPLENARYREYLGTIVQSGRHLLGIVNDLLDLAKYDAGRLEIRTETVDVEAAVEAAVETMRQQAERAGLTVQTRNGAAALKVTADRKRLHQILLNLLSNATKFTPPGGSITVSTEPHRRGTCIAVRDTGIGMTPEEIPLALERFGQIDSRLQRKFEGTGLGLPLTKALVELQGGTLSVESTPGEGTTVSVVLPAAEAEDIVAA